MNLTLSQLQTELLRIYAHDLTPTNVLVVEHTAGAVCFKTDNTELEKQLAHASAELAEAKRNTQRTKHTQ